MNRTLTGIALVSLAAAAIGAASASAQTAADPRPTLKVGTASAARGQKATGVIAVPAGVDAATTISVVVVHGAKPGPVLAVVSGLHGTEYASILAVERLIQLLDHFLRHQERRALGLRAVGPAGIEPVHVLSVDRIHVRDLLLERRHVDQRHENH